MTNKLVKYISILRGINVGGKRKILMEDLRAMYKALGFSDVITYIQSGNVIFNTSTTNLKELEEKIKDSIAKKFGFDVPVIIRSIEEMQQVVSENPFSNEADFEPKKLYVTFLSEPIDRVYENNILPQEYLPDRFKIMGQHIYVYYAEKISSSKLIQSLFEKQYKVTATTRNWNSVNKLVELAEK
ncbi:MAG: DUF1697 domain-containing protein [Chitinophagales bacterium]